MLLRRTAALAAMSFLTLVPTLRAADVEVRGKGNKTVTLNVPQADVDHAALEKLGWKLGSQFYTFREYSAFETIDILKAMGLKYGELYPGQRLSPDKPDVKTGPEMSDEDLGALKKKLADGGVTAVNFGVCQLKDEAQARKTFEFARKLGLQTIVSEPSEDVMPMLDKLANEFQINVAIHNHPKPSHYWDPATVLKAIDGLSNRVGACADVGHWVRSDVPSIEGIKQLKGRIISLHFKDVVKTPDGSGARGYGDVPWGTGLVDVPAVLKQLQEQGFKGVFSVEYERTSGQELVDNVAKSVTNFSKVAKPLADAAPAVSAGSDKDAAAAINTLTDAEKQQGWVLLFNGKDTDGWRNFKKDAVTNWQVVDGVLTRVPGNGEDAVTVKQYDNYVLELDWRIAEKGNSGIIYRCDESGGAVWHTGPEYQLYDSAAKPADTHVAGALYDLYAPSTNPCKPSGEWNRTKLVLDGNHVEHWLNGQKLVTVELGSDDWNQKVAASKFNKFENFGKLKKGHIALQDHGQKVEFRNIKLLPLPAKSASAK